jgi:hypothetical protein
MRLSELDEKFRNTEKIVAELWKLSIETLLTARCSVLHLRFII